MFPPPLQPFPGPGSVSRTVLPCTVTLWSTQGTSVLSPAPGNPGDAHQVWLSTTRRVKCHRALSRGVPLSGVSCPHEGHGADPNPALPDSPAATSLAGSGQNVEDSV